MLNYLKVNGLPLSRCSVNAAHRTSKAGTPGRSQAPPENKSSQARKAKPTSMVPQTPRNSAVRSAQKEHSLSSDVHCAQTPLPPMSSGKTLSRSAGQQENSREQIQTPRGSFGVTKMYANFKARFAELLDLDAKRDQQNRDIRDQIMTESIRDSKIVERWIQEEKHKHLDHQRRKFLILL